MTRVLFVTHDLVGPKMAGPAIRCWELAAQVAKSCHVTLASKLPIDRAHPDFAVTSFDDQADKLIALAKAADVLVVQGLMLYHFPGLTRLGKFLVVDLYDPFVFESYPYFDSLGDGRDEVFLLYTDILNAQLAHADFMLCASERQRDLWLGMLGAVGRLTPDLFAADPSMRSLMARVPFGLPDARPVARRPVLRGQVPGIGHEDFLLLWGGGIWNWFDPLTVIRAIGKISRVRHDVKLYFLGTRHPNPEIPEMAMTAKAMALADELGLIDRSVFFNPGWVSYEDRQAYLVEASAGISAHFDSLETRFSFRTRVLDYLWAGMPILSTAGDGMAELVDREGLGAVLPVNDVGAWVGAITALADDPERSQAIRVRVERTADQFRWSEVAKPLIAYCETPHSPRRLLDGVPSLRQTWLSGGQSPLPSSPRGLAGKANRAVEVLRTQGSRALFRKALRSLLSL
ncbi:MAG: glycosyltransferase family 4 protein [Cyanobacteria bacterium REEB65]|nr:glycosyltransferase family 4 protein [Cyanobacteria bacterium REEB65]